MKQSGQQTDWRTIVANLCEWESLMGGWDSHVWSVWRDARLALESTREKPEPIQAVTLPGATADEALLAIEELLDGTVWGPDTLNEIAQIMEQAGYRIRDRKE